MYCYIWSFEVRPEFLKQFQAAYGPGGNWVQLFRNDPGYIDTYLLGDREHPTRFLTVDFWSRYEDWVSFRERFKSRFEDLDRSFEQFTLEEVHIGSFNVIGDDRRVFSRKA